MSHAPEDLAAMRRALDLAARGGRLVAPNPLVGCVLLARGRVIGEGWHARHGERHAEVAALEAVRPEDRGLLAEATAYVTLEPCSHHGNTPPCADRLVAEGIPRVVVGAGDPDPRVSGRGLECLRAAGVDVVEGVLAEACRWQNRGFRMRVRHHRPWVLLKWAETADGFLGAPGGRPVRISNAASSRLTHRWRAQSGAILVGTRTVLSDDPELTVRHAPGGHPLRVVLDRSGRVPASARVFDAQAPTLRVAERAPDPLPGVEDLLLPFDESLLPALLEELAFRGVNHLMVEGGAATLGRFIDDGLWDEAVRFRSPEPLGDGIPAPLLPGVLTHRERLGSDWLDVYQPRDRTMDRPFSG
jgi:diaminohydroxyphosphoribosylaminopyrimidine deaminase/5-amino-6-(5-phosphoribosylamino)uracil reductase